MTDRDKIVGELEYCKNNPNCSACEGCQRGGRGIATCESLVDDVIALLKEQEEKPLRCKTCTVRDKTGFCYEWKREVKDDDYCSFGAWKGR